MTGVLRIGRGRYLPAIPAMALAIGAAFPAAAEDHRQYAWTYNSYGYPGLIDMPVAHSRPDAELAFASSYFAGQWRNTLTFQMLPRLSASFRYSSLEDIRPNVGGAVVNSRLDRSFSLHFRFIDESAGRPAVAVGLNDFLGTGIYSSEYFVASKTFGENLRVTGGIGWGRLGSNDGFRNPLSYLIDDFRSRDPESNPFGGTVNTGRWFQGDAALFGGIEWRATDRLTLTAEYSSDRNLNETPSAFTHEIPLNFGASYRLRPGVDVAARYLYGSEFGVQLSMALNPKEPPGGSGRDPAPPPVVPREPLDAGDLGWPAQVTATATLERRTARALAEQGIRLHGFALSESEVRLEIENETYQREAQAIGRAARLLTGLMPPRVETFVIVPVVNGLAGVETRIARGDMETLEYALQGSWHSYRRAGIAPAARPGTPAADGRYPHFDWRLKPYITPSLFDPDEPLRADAGAELFARFEPARGLEFSGTLRQKVVGNLDESTRKSTSVLPRVRSESNIYDREGDPAIIDLMGSYYFQPMDDIYGRVSAGYLERMFGGISGEMLWKPVDSRFALGVEVNYVQQRDFDQLWGFQDYDVATGHVSAYWDMGLGYHAQVDAGRYLAGDWGATLTVEREFENGWKIGAFATLTDVPFSTFGEGSFDKGLRLTIPIGWISGEPTREAYTATIRPVTRDGGARLDMRGRLYEKVRPLHEPELRDGWGRFWR